MKVMGSHGGWYLPRLHSGRSHLIAKHPDVHAALPRTKVYVQRCQLSPRRSGISTSSGVTSPLTEEICHFIAIFFRPYLLERWKKQTLFQGILEFHFTTDSREDCQGSGGTGRVKFSTLMKLWEKRGTPMRFRSPGSPLYLTPIFCMYATI